MSAAYMAVLRTYKKAVTKGYQVLRGKLKEKFQLERLGVFGKITLKGDFKK